MAQLLYFVPIPTGPNGVDLKYFKSLGLADRVGFAEKAQMDGPGGDGRQGLCFCRDPHGLLYDADGQTWEPGHDGKYLIGFSNADPPGPDDLARDTMIMGSGITLADGREWTIPHPRLAPQVIHSDGNGSVAYRNLPVGDRLWRHADRLVAYYEYLEATAKWRKAKKANPETETPEPECPYTDAQFLEIAADALAVNYRISPRWQEEVSALGLFTTENIHSVLLAMIALRDPVVDGGKKK